MDLSLTSMCMIGGNRDSDFKCQAIGEKDKTNSDAAISQPLDELNNVENSDADSRKINYVMIICEPHIDSMKILSHDLNDGPLIGDRDSLLNETDNLSCSSCNNRQNTDSDKTVANAFDDLIASGTSDEKQVFIISFCSPIK